VRNAAAVSAKGGGCPFSQRCPLATDLCTTERPALRMVGESAVACHYA
jgi:peptide/nickel transport system ATP-binding protein